MADSRNGRPRAALRSAITAGLARRFGRGRAGLLDGVDPDAPAAGVPETGGQAEAVTAVATARIGSVLFVAGEPDTAGAEFRARRACSACLATGRMARWIRLWDVSPEALRGVDLLVLWRATWSTHVETMVALARAAGARVAFDVDDLVVDPAMARPEIIDGMRTMGVGEAHLAGFFAEMRSTLLAADFAVATTDELAFHLRRVHTTVHVVPNGFDRAAHARTRMACRARSCAPSDGLLRIGYAAGTQSHQRDFAAVAGAVAAVLRDRPAVRLVLFRDAADGREMLITAEFAALAAVRDRIEWRDTVAVEALADEVARFDVAICPLETGNPFCEAKSEIKFVEAALAGVPCVASPSGPLSRAIADGVTGLLARDEAGWRAALLALVDDASLRRRIGLAAYCDVLWRFGPQRAALAWDEILCGLEGPREAARQHELRVSRGLRPRNDTPAIAETETLFAHDTLGEAAVAVAVTSFNYAGVIEEALASAGGQTLAALELVVVDDCSTDGSAERIVAWAKRHCGRFTRVRVERTLRNGGLGAARNAAFAAAGTEYVMSLDADNRLLPLCCETLLGLAEREGAAFAYSTLHSFGGESPKLSAAVFDPTHLVGGNYIDAMALVAKWAWAAAGGYYDQADARGWEDYGLWCRLAELGQFGVWHPVALAEYRVHSGSMTNAVTETATNKRALVEFMEGRHPWVRLRSREEEPRGVLK